jgi:hypothetical protein
MIRLLELLTTIINEERNERKSGNISYAAIGRIRLWLPNRISLLVS